MLRGLQTFTVVELILVGEFLPKLMSRQSGWSRIASGCVCLVRSLPRGRMMRS